MTVLLAVLSFPYSYNSNTVILFSEQDGQKFQKYPLKMKSFRAKRSLLWCYRAYVWDIGYTMVLIKHQWNRLLCTYSWLFWRLCLKYKAQRKLRIYNKMTPLILLTRNPLSLSALPTSSSLKYKSRVFSLLLIGITRLIYDLTIRTYHTHAEIV